MFEEFDKDKIQVGQSLEESWFYYYKYYISTGELDKALGIYSLLSSTIYKNSAKLYKYLFIDGDSVLLEDYLMATGTPAQFTLHFQKLRELYASNNYAIANEIIGRVQSHIDDDNLEDLYFFYEKEPDNNVYLFSEFHSDVDAETAEQFKEYEMILIFDVMENRFEDFANDLKNLSSLYGNDFSTYYQIFSMFNNKLAGLMNMTVLNERNGSVIEGNILSVINKLLISNDFYRASEVIEQLDHNTMFYLILHEQATAALELIDEHELVEKRNLIYNCIEVESPMEALPHNVNGSYDGELLVNLEPLCRGFEEEPNSFYYSLYQEEYNKKNYMRALRYLLKFKEYVADSIFSKDISYLEQELYVKIFNSLKKDGRLEVIEERIAHCEENDDYSSIIDYVDEYNTLADISDPRLACSAAYAAYELGDYNFALNTYEQIGSEYLGPDDYAIMMECALQLQDFGKVVTYGRKYNALDEDSSVKVNYMLSIAYGNLMDYDTAIQMIYNCREMNRHYFDVPNTYKNEEEILNSLASGVEVEMYTIEQYVDFQTTREEADIDQILFEMERAFNLEDVKKELRKIKEPKEKIMYMLAVIKILIKNEYDKQKDVATMINYLEGYVKRCKLTEADREVYEFQIKNYKKI